ncbi:hypothetical protein BDN72DRAFT_876371 [Pluteus cervinus]|uniref:Uncharacterized protein n=1 Tax=Pluteus cervinus TaxID=181527 RepID=A0ACD3B4V6_9AGAR|nr:hypothetical protein BDN72DRAFT_876371 [Pluteus cervinus]
MALCDGDSLFDLTEYCIRELWVTALPVALVAAICLSSVLGHILPKPKLFGWLDNPLKTHLTVEEAEALHLDSDSEVPGRDEAEVEGGDRKAGTSRWTTLLFVGVGSIQFLIWTSMTLHRFLNISLPAPATRGIAFNAAMALAWGYTAMRPISRTTITAPLDLLTFYLLFAIGGVVKVGELLYAKSLGWEWETWNADMVFELANLGVVMVLLWIILGMPLEVPSSRVDEKRIGEDISPEDYTTLSEWITFSWVYPLIKKFTTFRHPTLVKRLIAANSLDIILDFFMTAMSVLMNYSGPFFLKKILDLIDIKNPTTEQKMSAYIYAFLAFICALLKGEADLLHLWFSRRASTRVRSELMAAIYDKALKRKDFSGIVNKDNTNEDVKAKPNEPKAGADIGKIVNLMASDADQISFFVAATWFMYGAPFEIIIASAFLYQLMGLSAFAGLIALVLGWPINRYITNRIHQITRGSAVAKDKRMGVVAEMIAAIKPIKFFAWEDHWISRVMKAREEELRWMVKGRLNSVNFQLLWSLAPVAVSVIAFLVYVYQGNELTVGTAFTAIALFTMVKRPLNVVPIAIFQVARIGVAVKRIAVYLEEEEVDDQVSSLKAQASFPNPSLSHPHGDQDQDEDSGLGIINGTFKWNEIGDEVKTAGTKGIVSTEVSQGNGKGKTLPLLQSQHGHGSSSTTMTITVTKSTTTDTGAHGLDVESTITASTLVREGTSELEAGKISGDAEEKFELRGISVVFPEGKLTVVAGPTASGKTALLTALLGELTTLSGCILLPKNLSKVDENGYTHSISYAAQTPWLQHQTIKENILFGSPYDEDRYRETVVCCALIPDFEALEDGDETEIGMRGVSLSGGQKARVALARAVYSRTKYVLLDDPLSAVDSHTARFLFERLFCGPLFESRTVVLVTHHLELVLPGTYYLVRMLNGRIDTQGTIVDLTAQGILEHIKHDAEAEADVKVADAGGTEKSPADKAAVEDETKKSPRKLVEDEHRETGGVKWHVYDVYLRACSYSIWAVVFLIIIATQILGFAEKLWIKTWGEAYGSGPPLGMILHSSLSSTVSGAGEISEGHSSFMLASQNPLQVPISNNTGTIDGVLHHVVSPLTEGFLGTSYDLPNAKEHPMFFVVVYAVIGFATALAGILLTLVVYTAGLRASRIIFKRLLETVVRAPFRFHDTTPQGRLLNRFGKDLETVDSKLYLSIQSVVGSLLAFFASVLTVAVFFPIFLIPASVLGFVYYFSAVSYLKTGRDLRRMEANFRSPIFSDFGEILDGIVTVRAFAAEKRFLDGIHKKIDKTTQMLYMYWMANRWLSMTYDVLGATAVLITMILSIATLHDGAGLAGICITSAMTFTTSTYWACRGWTDFELDLNSVERVVEYLDLPQEPPTRIAGHEVPAYWPSTSRNDSLISVENLVVKYAPDLPPVLQNVSFTLRAGERVGLLGRTGSGKSTLSMSLLRFVDPTEGRIIIDGIDISTIGLYDLRSRLTFIPQDATLFSGTLRENIDPFNEHTDAECLDVLRRVQIIGDNTSASGSHEQTPIPSRPQSVNNASVTLTVAEHPSTSSSSSHTERESKVVITLDSQVSAGGTNFSQGQRQLVAMARAVLRRSSIIILDEATSSIDFKTDAKIQQTIREEFTDSLLLTVAHRIRTVIDYDRLIVLDKGQVAELDTPWNLIRKEGGIFRQMCLKSGAYSELYALAEATAEGA